MNLRSRNESAWLLPLGDDRVSHSLRREMRTYPDDEEVDVVVVGVGAGGATLLQRLAHSGWRVVGLEAGPFWDPDADWVSDEAGSHQLYWTEPPVIAGGDPGALGSNKSRGGGGGSVGHFPRDVARLPPPGFAT